MTSTPERSRVRRPSKRREAEVRGVDLGPRGKGWMVRRDGEGGEEGVVNWEGVRDKVESRGAMRPSLRGREVMLSVLRRVSMSCDLVVFVVSGVFSMVESVVYK